METLLVVLGSAGAGALISSAVNGFFSWLTKRAEFDRQDLAMALKIAELRHQQIVKIAEWSKERGNRPKLEIYDPLVQLIEYRRGIEEYRKTGTWKRGEETHPQFRPLDNDRGR